MMMMITQPKTKVIYRNNEILKFKNKDSTNCKSFSGQLNSVKLQNKSINHKLEFLILRLLPVTDVLLRTMMWTKLTSSRITSLVCAD